MKNELVLLVFDEPRDLETYGSILCGLGYRIMMCSSLAEGIQAIENEDVSFVIAGQGTPAFENRELLEKLLQINLSIPALIISRVADMRCYFEAMDLGAIDYLESPAPNDIAWIIDTQKRKSKAA